ncbi:MAG: helix-turn-helix transcriptional regulator [Erysipelotrichaceae bacterium]|nr:helix-turn-helix transcriptional regulator [Erysipelotrichaceae bacterium]
MKELDRTKLSKLLARLRNSRDLSREDMGELLGVSGRTVKRWENGESIPSMEDIIHICNEFGVSLKEIFEGEISIDKEVDRKLSKVNSDIQSINDRMVTTEEKVSDINDGIESIKTSLVTLSSSSEMDKLNSYIKKALLCALVLFAICGLLYYRNSYHSDYMKPLESYGELQKEVAAAFDDVQFPDLGKYGFTGEKYYIHLLNRKPDSHYIVYGFVKLEGIDNRFDLSVCKGYNDFEDEPVLINGNKVWLETKQIDSGHIQVNCEAHINGYTYEIITFIDRENDPGMNVEQVCQSVQEAYLLMLEDMISA